MQGQNLFLTTDKYSAVSFGFDKNTWSLYEDGKTFVLSVNPKYIHIRLTIKSNFTKQHPTTPRDPLYRRQGQGDPTTPTTPAL